MRTVDTPEPFAPLGAPIRPGAAKPQPKPESVAPGIVRDPDGNLRTVIPPPSAPAPALRPMQGRDQASQAWEGTEPTIPASAWPAYCNDYQAGYRDGYAAAMKAKP